MALRFTLRQLEYFVAVGEEGSIALASERVNVSSPSISIALSRLEAEFGLTLFLRRHAHGLALTQAGQQFMIQAKQLLRDAEGLGYLAGDISNNVQGPLSVGCLLTFAQLVVPGLRRQFESRYPDVTLRQRELHQSEIYTQLRRAEIDVALTYDLDIPQGIEFLPLLELPPYIMVGQDHPLAHLSQVRVDQLQDHPMVLLDLPLSRDYFLSFFSDIGLVPKIAERTRDMAVVRSLVANGFGYGIAAAGPESDKAPDGRPLRFIPLTGKVRPMKLGIAMMEGAATALTISAFIAHCRDHVTAEKMPGLILRPTSTP